MDLESLFAGVGETSYYDDLQFIVDEDLRTIAIPQRGKVAGVRSDKDVNRVAISINRYYDGTDLSEFSVKINYVNANGQPNYFRVTDRKIDTDSLVLIWLLSSDVTAYKGNVVFAIQFYKADEGTITQEFNTTIATMVVLDGLQVEDYITPPDKVLLIEQLKQETEVLLEPYVEEKIEEIEQAGAQLFVHQDTEENWNAKYYLIGEPNHIYIYTNHSRVDGHDIPAMKIGSGSYLIDQPFVDSDAEVLDDHIKDTVRHITQNEREFWNNKVRGEIESRTLVLTTL
ncbi:MAG: hypothetical protein J6U54_09645 [Clostridiales bacterium]|nr:hypothetical protein [Clostridiales bacterium]